MARIVLLLIIGFLVYALFRGFFRAQVKDQRPEAKSIEGEDMVACARCGVNMPRSEAREQSGSFFCRDNPRCIAGP
jgi:uncharacterized protein